MWTRRLARGAAAITLGALCVSGPLLGCEAAPTAEAPEQPGQGPVAEGGVFAAPAADATTADPSPAAGDAIDAAPGSGPTPGAPPLGVRDAQGSNDAAANDAGGGACGAAPGPLTSSSVAVQFADGILARWPDPRNIGGSMHGWDYTVGVVLQGLARVYGRTGDDRYLAYIRQYADDFIDDAGANSGLPAIPPTTNYDLDNFEPGNLLLWLYAKTGVPRYQAAAQSLLSLFDDYPRNDAGGFWHKGTYPDQMWLDGIYMAEPFIAGYGAQFPSCGAFCTTTPGAQIELIAQRTIDPDSGLFFHGWDQSLTASWADPHTGRSPVVWSRGLGWFAMALIDVLAVTPSSNTVRPRLIALLQGLASGLAAHQDAKTGLWYEVVENGCSGNFLETSGSGMFIYALKAAVDACYIDASYLAVAQRAWSGLQGEITSDSIGPVITNAVAPMSVEGSCNAYVSASTQSNSGQGLCGVLMASSAME
jgi:unsaturated rhamnogalacturonyl hydrolase